MRQFQKILFVSQGAGDETEALKQALWISRSSATALHALIVSPPLPKPLDSYRDAWERSLSDRLKATAQTMEAALQPEPLTPLPVSVEPGRTPAIRVVRKVMRDGYDLVVKQAEPTEGGSGFSAIDMQLMRLCPCPLWLCRPTAHSRSEVRIAVAVDPINEEPAGHALTLSLLKLSRELADTFSGELAVISCWDYEFEDDLIHSPWIRMPRAEVAQIVGSTEREHRSALDAVIKDAEIAGTIRLRHARGKPHRMIPLLVEEEKIDLLVMGTVARTGIPGFLIGNTAENVVRTLKCSLLVLKPPGFVSAVRPYD